jgi:hypothetical protein
MHAIDEYAPIIIMIHTSSPPSLVAAVPIPVSTSREGKQIISFVTKVKYLVSESFFSFQVRTAKSLCRVEVSSMLGFWQF